MLKSEAGAADVFGGVAVEVFLHVLGFGFPGFFGEAVLAIGLPGAGGAVDEFGGADGAAEVVGSAAAEVVDYVEGADGGCGEAGAEGGNDPAGGGESGGVDAAGFFLFLGARPVARADHVYGKALDGALGFAGFAVEDGKESPAEAADAVLDRVFEGFRRDVPVALEGPVEVVHAVCFPVDHLSQLMKSSAKLPVVLAMTW